MVVPDFGSGILDVVARSAIVYLVLLGLLRFGGKRQVGQLSIADLVLVLLIANGVQNAMVGENTTPHRRARRGRHADPHRPGHRQGTATVGAGPRPCSRASRGSSSATASS